jgi:hypothetical protein
MTAASRDSSLRVILGVLAWLGFIVTGRADDWKYDTVTLKGSNPIVLKGLLYNYSEKSSIVTLRVVTRNGVEKTKLTTRVLLRDEIASIERLDDKDRAVLEARIRALDPSPKELAERIRTLELTRIDWGKDGKKNGFRYEGDNFTIESNLKEEIFRRTAVRLAQVFSAYGHFLPAQVPVDEPPRILLAQSMADYRALLKERDINLANPAYYDPQRNEIVCGCELDRLGTLLDEARSEYRKVRDKLKADEAELNKIYKGKIPPELLRPITDARKKMDAADQENDRKYAEATAQLFRRLNHECFHAYLANSVYPPSQAEIPRWLNEGLAQIFESALFESDSVRIGLTDPDRLKRAQTALSAGELVPLTDLLRSGPKQFLVLHADDRQTSDRYYLTSWALAIYLTSERKVIGTPAFDEYARSTFRKVDPVEAFCTLLGIKTTELPKFEKEFHDSLRKMQPPR